MAFNFNDTSLVNSDYQRPEEETVAAAIDNLLNKGLRRCYEKYRIRTWFDIDVKSGQRPTVIYNKLLRNHPDIALPKALMADLQNWYMGHMDICECMDWNVQLPPCIFMSLSKTDYTKEDYFRYLDWIIINSNRDNRHPAAVNSVNHILLCDKLDTYVHRYTLSDLQRIHQMISGNTAKFHMSDDIIKYAIMDGQFHNHLSVNNPELSKLLEKYTYISSLYDNYNYSKFNISSDF